MLRQIVQNGFNFPSLPSHFVESTSANILPKFIRWKKDKKYIPSHGKNIYLCKYGPHYEYFNYNRTNENIWSEKFLTIKDIVTSLCSNEIYNNTYNFTMLWYQLHQLSNSRINRNK